MIGAAPPSYRAQTDINQKNGNLKDIQTNNFLDEIAAADDSIESDHHQEDCYKVIVMADNKIHLGLSLPAKVKKMLNITANTEIPTPSSTSKIPMC